MGEIKSTLDLVMEKTRHMTLSRKERETQKVEEIRKKLNGLIQKYADGLLRKDQFLKEFDKLEHIETQSNERLLCAEILSRIEFENETEPLLALLEFVCRFDIGNLTAILGAFATQLDAARADRIGEMKQALCKDTGISGSAVLPNLESDAVFKTHLVAMKDDYRKRLAEEKNRLLI